MSVEICDACKRSFAESDLVKKWLPMDDPDFPELTEKLVLYCGGCVKWQR